MQTKLIKKFLLFIIIYILFQKGQVFMLKFLLFLMIFFIVRYFVIKKLSKKFFKNLKIIRFSYDFVKKRFEEKEKNQPTAEMLMRNQPYV